MPVAEHPRTLGSALSRAALIAMRGWRFEGAVPTAPRAVILAGPHTSNVDGLLLVLLTRSVGMDARWMVKDSWARQPMGWALDRVGAVPIDRSAPRGMVGQMIEEFERRERFHLMIPPEGTRSRTEFWKSGFYRIAEGAGVPVIPSYLDYQRKRGGFGEAVELTGDIVSDMDRFREFYRDGAAMARHPEKYGPVRLRDEGDPSG